MIPAGLAQTKRKYIAARFPKDAPSFVAEEYVVGFEQAPGKQVKEPSLLLSRKNPKQQQQQQQQGSKDLPNHHQGVPRTDAPSNYFVLSKSGGKWDFVVQPLETTFTFKKLVKGPGPSIEEAEAEMRPAAGARDPARFLPKSMRQQLQDAAAAEAAEKKLQEEVVPLFDKAKVAELAVKYGAGSSQGKLVVGHSDDEGSDEGWGATLGEDDEGAAGRKRGPGKDKKGAKGAGKGRKGAKESSGPDIPEDEMPEDIYAGEEDELRPAAPTEDVDWEFQDDRADDDMDQGASDDEQQPDDPGLRKQLGLEADDDEEEEAKKEAGLAADEAEGADKAEGQGAAAPAAAGADGAAAGAAGGPSQASVGGSAESDDVEDEMLLEGEEDVDPDYLDRLAEGREPNVGASHAAKRRKGSVGPAGRDRSPAPGTAAASRHATPPLGAGSSRATPQPGSGLKRGATPPPGSKAAAAGAASGSSRQGSVGAGARKTPPPSAAAAAAGRRTPPPAAASAGAAKRKREEGSAAGGAGAAAAGAMAAAAGVGRGYVWRPEQLDAKGVPTVEAMQQALEELGPITTTQLNLLQEHLDVARIGDEGKKLLKSRMLQVAKVEVINGVKYVVLKHSG